ncbi:MAG: hypothetical protein OHK0024_13720 [Thalassobaculales bacterium]
MIDRLRQAVERGLTVFVGCLVVGLFVVVTVAVVYRLAGASLVWYDEAASIMLAWLTYYGSALAALKRAHMGFDGLVRAMPGSFRLATFALGEVCTIGFFLLAAVVGYEVLMILAGDSMVSLPWVPTQLTHSVIPVGAALFVLCQLLSLPQALARVGIAAQPPVKEALE